MSSSPRTPFAGRISTLESFKHSLDCRAFDSKGLEDERFHDIHYPIVTVRRIHGRDGSRRARLTGDIIKQHFCQTPIVGSLILLTENFLRDKFVSLHVVQHSNAIHLFVLLLKSASIKRIAQSLETSRLPNIFSDMTERPFGHCSNAMPFFRESKTCNA